VSGIYLELVSGNSPELVLGISPEHVGFRLILSSVKKNEMDPKPPRIRSALILNGL